MRHRRRRVHGHPHAERRDHHDRLARDRTRRHASGVVLGERRAARLQRRPLQRPVRRRPGNGPRLEQRARAPRQLLAPAGAAPRDRRRARGLRSRPDLLRSDPAQRSVVRRHSVERGALPRPGRDAARRRQCLPQPRPRRHLRADRAPGPEGLLPRRGRRGDARGDHRSARRRRRRSRVAAGCDERERPAQLQRTEQTADARDLPRPRCLGDGAALERRFDRRRGAQPAVRLRPRGRSHESASPLLRGEPRRVRGPRRLAG